MASRHPYRPGTLHGPGSFHPATPRRTRSLPAEAIRTTAMNAHPPRGDHHAATPEVTVT